ncbi:MAG: hypothetical protein WAX77_13330 [Methylococcaceae bacterium]
MTTQGAIITDFKSYDKGQYVIQINGKIYVLGTTSGLNSDDLAIARYNSNGSLDTSFDGDGKFITPATMTINTVQVASDGKFYTIGSSNSDFAITRYNATGSLDTSFSGDGKVTNNMNGTDAALAMTMQVDGKLVVAGYSASGYSVSVARYNPDGSLDSTLSSDGLIVGNDTYISGYASALAVQPDGKTIIAGNNVSFDSQQYNGDFKLARLDRYGALDNSFGAQGVSTTDLGGIDLLKTVTVLGTGKILAAGISNGNFALVRYNNNGSLDTSFDNDGKVITQLNVNASLNSIVVSADGKFIAAGTDNDNNDILLMRFNSNGSLDNTFGTNGKVTTNLGGWEEGNSVTLQSDGKILVAGSSDTNFALVRYNTNGTLDTSFTGTAAVQHAPTGQPAINDTTPTVGNILTASQNTLADADGIKTAITYTWKTGTTVLGTGATHSVTTAEVGKTLTVTASYTDGLGKAESVTSAVTAAVVNAPVISTAGVSIIGSDFSTSEQGDSAVFSVKLNSAPTRDVTISFKSTDTSEAIISGSSSFTFNSANWATAQTLTIKGVSDSLIDGNVAYSITGQLTSIDVIYKTITVKTLTLTNQDTPVAQKETINGTDNVDILQGTSAPSYILGKAGDDDISGGAGNDTLYGSYGDDVLFGEDGNDYLWGEQDADYLDGGAGNDTLDGGTGADTIIGGTGNDTYYLGYDVADIILDGGASADIDTVIMPYQLSSYTLPTGIENGKIAQGTSNSNLTGNTSNNTLTGNDGINNLSGGLGRDSLFGGIGNDVLEGGTDNDVLTGGTGKDTFKLITTPNTTTNQDKIADYSVVDDTIQLENAIFTKLTTTGVLNSSYFKIGTAAGDTNDYIIYNSSTGTLTYDSDGSGSGVGIQIATLGVNLPLTNADFVVI